MDSFSLPQPGQAQAIDHYHGPRTALSVLNLGSLYSVAARVWTLTAMNCHCLGNAHYKILSLIDEFRLFRCEYAFVPAFFSSMLRKCEQGKK